MAKSRRTSKPVSENTPKKKNVEFSISPEIITFLNSQKYFIEFTKARKEQYIKRIASLYRKDYLIKHHKRVLISNVFMDEEFVNYKSSTNTISYTAFILVPMFIPIYLALVSFYPEANFLKNVTLKFSMFSTILGLSGALLTGLDILIDQKRLKVWDKNLFILLDSYKKGWLDSLKVSALISIRPLGAMSYALNSTLQIYLYLYLFGLVDFPNQKIISVYFFWLGIYLFNERATKSQKYFGLILMFSQLLILYSNYQLKAFTNSEISSIALFSLYCYEISAITRHYLRNGDSRKIYYYAFLFWGSPWIFFKCFYRTIPFLFFLPIYSLFKVIIYLKPTSILRSFGLILIVIAFFI
ncbi:MAG: hypothetical protein KKB34_05435 [Bacteroidetes bacterium]|nr:hypothetical protein [Bacteroidota bacterium]